MVKEIIRLLDNGLSNRQISKHLDTSRTTIIKYSSKIKECGISLKELMKLEDKDLNELFEENLELSKSDRKSIYLDLLACFPHVDKELARVGVSRKLLWREYKQKHPNGVMYSQFCDHYLKWSKVSQAYMPIEHKAGEKLFIDYAGKKLHLVDLETGELKAVEVFVATLGASQYTYVEASYSQKVEDFIHSVQNCMEFFGGVPQCIVPDNLKSAVTTANKYEPLVNEKFAGFGTHYNTTIMPARALKPKDKSLVESAVNNTYRRIHASLRDRLFYSLESLNLAIKELLISLNNTPFQKKEYSRDILFHTVEKEALRPLPVERYELPEYKIATVQKNSHVVYTPDKNYYSVPYTLMGKKVKLILTAKAVEIYHEQIRVAIHPRSRKSYSYTTDKEHMPTTHCYNQAWNPDYFIQRADKIGESVRLCIEQILQQKKFPEQGYKSCEGILSLATKVGHLRLDNACKRAITYQMVGYKHILNTLERGLDNEQELEQIQPKALPSHDNIRGAAYYQTTLLT